MHIASKQTSQTAWLASDVNMEWSDTLYIGPVDSTALDMCWASYCYGRGLLADRHLRIEHFLHDVGDSIGYIYDLGDHWRHVITLESRMEPQDGIALLDGWGACPPEDFGGPRKYAEVATWLQYPRNQINENWLDGLVNEFACKQFGKKPIPTSMEDHWWNLYNEFQYQSGARAFDPCFFDRASAEKRLKTSLRTIRSRPEEAFDNYAVSDLTSPVKFSKAYSRGDTFNLHSDSVKACEVCGIKVSLQKCPCGHAWYCSEKQLVGL